MNLYAGFIDLTNKDYKLYTIDVEEIKENLYKASRGMHINYSTTTDTISKEYFELLLHIGQTLSDKVYLYYSLNKNSVIDEILNYVNAKLEKDEPRLQIGDIKII